ncbi:MAG TPA: PPC domain-containing DNA-binding protein [Candidatus Aquilonibacter sp.]|nr:PPC domain-containing DNA-binding protein [Candidatus Aquilonibacter sp.]
MKFAAKSLAQSILLVSLTAACGMAQQAQYISPTETGPHGSAPGMRVKALSSGKGPNDYAVIFRDGDDPYAGLTQFAAQYHIHSAHFTAIGALRDARLGFYDPERRMYRVIPVDSQVEVVSLIGDIAELDGKPAVHMHCVVAFPDGHTLGGHFLSAHVRPLLEVFVTADPVTLRKRHDAATGLSLMDPDAK